MKSSPVGYKNTKYTHPVVLIPGLNHASFLSGIPPIAVQQTDLRATISIEEAIDRVSYPCAAFLTITHLGKDSEDGKKAVAEFDHLIDEVTAPMLDPILEFSAIEGAPFMSSFKNVTPWVKISQEYVAGDLLQEKNINVIDEYKTFVAIDGEFSHAKPKIQSDSDDK